MAFDTIRRLRRAVLAAGCGVLAALTATTAQAAPPPGFAVRTLASGLDLPTAMAYAPGGRLLVAEKSGRVVAVGDDGTTTVIDLGDEVNSADDGGLLGIAADGAGRIYLMYTRELDPARPDRAARAEGVVARYGLRPGTTEADPASRRVLVSGYDIAPLNHAGGALRFDPQGRLLIAFGDGARWQNVDPRALRAQDPDDLAGKILRIDPDTGAGLPENPFYQPGAPTSVRSRTLAMGLRNPFRFGLDPLTGDVWIGDVGWNAWEELDVLSPDAADSASARNFGWPCYEGGPGAPLVQPGYARDASTRAVCAGVLSPLDGGTGTGTVAPVFARAHAGDNASLTGGPAYRGDAYPAAYRGAVFLADYARDEFLTYTPQTGATAFGTPGGWGNPVDIQPTPQGTLAYVAIGAGEVREIVHTGTSAPPRARIAADRASGAAPLTVRLSGAGSTDPDGGALRMRWSFGDGATSTASAPTHRFARGSYTVRLTVTDPQGAEGTATLDVDAGNTRPSVAIAMADTFRVGQTVPFTIAARDAEDGVLAPGRVRYQVVVHHLTHLHYGVERTGTSGEIEVTDHGDDVDYEVRATATDSRGGITTVSRRIVADSRPFTVTSEPPGVAVIVDGNPRATPDTRPSAIGAAHTVVAPAAVRIGGRGYTLAGIDGGAVSTTGDRLAVTTPAGPQTVVVRYTAETAPVSESGTTAPAHGGGTTPHGPAATPPAPAVPGGGAGVLGPSAVRHRLVRSGGRLRLTVSLARPVAPRTLLLVQTGGPRRWRSRSMFLIAQKGSVRLTLPTSAGRIRLMLRARSGTPWVTAGVLEPPDPAPVATAPHAVHRH